MLTFLKNFIMKKYDLIERKNAPYFVIIDPAKIDEVVTIIKKRKLWIDENENIKPHIKKKLNFLTEDLVLIANTLKTSVCLTLAPIKHLTKEELEQENTEQSKLTDFVEETETKPEIDFDNPEKG